MGSVYIGTFSVPSKKTADFFIKTSEKRTNSVFALAFLFKEFYLITYSASDFLTESRITVSNSPESPFSISISTGI